MVLLKVAPLPSSIQKYSLIHKLIFLEFEKKMSPIIFILYFSHLSGLSLEKELFVSKEKHSDCKGNFSDCDGSFENPFVSLLDAMEKGIFDKDLQLKIILLDKSMTINEIDIEKKIEESASSKTLVFSQETQERKKLSLIGCFLCSRDHFEAAEQTTILFESRIFSIKISNEFALENLKFVFNAIGSKDENFFFMLGDSKLISVFLLKKVSFLETCSSSDKKENFLFYSNTSHFTLLINNSEFNMCFSNNGYFKKILYLSPLIKDPKDKSYFLLNTSKIEVKIDPSLAIERRSEFYSVFLRKVNAKVIDLIIYLPTSHVEDYSLFYVNNCEFNLGENSHFS